MNILIITNELRYTCGVTNHILHLSNGLAEAKAVNLFIIAGGGNGVERFKNIKANIIVDKRFLHRGRSLTNYILAIKLLAKFIKKNRIDIIHSHNHYAANIARNAAKISRALTIQTNHGILKAGGRLKHFSAEKYIAINEHIFNYLTKNGIATDENIRLIRCGIPVDTVPANKQSGRIKIIAASRFNYDKGLDIFIKAAAGINETIGRKSEFYIAGEGELEQSLIMLNNQLNAGVKFLGSVKNMYDVLREDHILVCPTRSSSEGFPAVITEAGACNCLVISSDFSGVENVIEDKKNGFIFRSESVSELISKLENAVDNFSNYENMRLDFYNKIKTEYSIKEMTEKHLKLYRGMAKIA